MPIVCAVQNQEEKAAPHLYSTKTASHTAPHISYLLQIPDVVAAVLAAHRVVQDNQPDRLDVYHGSCRDRQTRTGLAYRHCLCLHAAPHSASCMRLTATICWCSGQRNPPHSTRVWMHAAKRQSSEHSDINGLTGHRHHEAYEVHSVPGPCMSGRLCWYTTQARGI
jgi:hypothetical protein